MPAFSAGTTEYTVTTSNNSNKVTATPADESATVTILLGDTPVENGSQVTWAPGENVLTITVTSGESSQTYTVAVTKQ